MHFLICDENLLHIIQQIDHVTVKGGPKYVALELREGVCFLVVGGFMDRPQDGPLSLERTFYPLFPHLEPFSRLLP